MRIEWPSITTRWIRQDLKQSWEMLIDSFSILKDRQVLLIIMRWSKRSWGTKEREREWKKPIEKEIERIKKREEFLPSEKSKVKKEDPWRILIVLWHGRIGVKRQGFLPSSWVRTVSGSEAGPTPTTVPARSHTRYAVHFLRSSSRNSVVEGLRSTSWIASVSGRLDST